VSQSTVERIAPPAIISPRAAPPSTPLQTRWTDPRVASVYARRDESLDRSLLWPLLAELVRPADGQRDTGRPDAEILELGSGLGGLSHLLATTQWTRTYAVDLSPAVHRAGVHRYQDDWVNRILPSRSSWRFPLADQLCTGAIAQFLLLHLRYQAEVIGVLSEARRVLRPGAPLVLLEPAGHGGPAGTVQWGGAQWGAAAWSGSRLEEGQAFLAHYRLRGGATFSASAWHHSPAALAGCLSRCGFRLTDITPLAVPGAHNPDPPFHLWQAVAE
jgi:SAM-dependent methyltransferase